MLKVLLSLKVTLRPVVLNSFFYYWNHSQLLMGAWVELRLVLLMHLSLEEVAQNESKKEKKSKVKFSYSLLWRRKKTFYFSFISDTWTWVPGSSELLHFWELAKTVKENMTEINLEIRLVYSCVWMLEYSFFLSLFHFNVRKVKACLDCEWTVDHRWKCVLSIPAQTKLHQWI